MLRSLLYLNITVVLIVSWCDIFWADVMLRVGQPAGRYRVVGLVPHDVDVAPFHLSEFRTCFDWLEKLPILIVYNFTESVLLQGHLGEHLALT